jgi:thiosulfate dehydrogenase [quinone] large subunit
MNMADMDKKELGEYILAVVRIMIGCTMLWPFFDKLFGLGFATPAGQGMIDGGSPSSFVIYVAGGIFKDFYVSLAGNQIVDIILMLGLLIMGVTLIIGIASKLTTVMMMVFLLVMYSLHVPPEDGPIIDYHLIQCVLMPVIYYLGGYEKLSVLDKWKELSLVKRFPILE